MAWVTFSRSLLRFGIPGALCACLAFAPLPAGAKVFLAQDEALELAFPGADRVEERVFFLKPSQKQAIPIAKKSRCL